MKYILPIAFALGIASPAIAAPVVTLDAQPAPYPLQPFVQSFTLSGPGILSGSITQLKLGKLDAGSAWISGPNGIVDFVTTMVSKPQATLTFAPINVTAGSYTLHFIDKSADDYFGSVDFTGTPEPATWGMLVLGFGLIGAGLRRSLRSRQGVTVSYT